MLIQKQQIQTIWDDLTLELEICRWTIDDGLGICPKTGLETCHRNFDPQKRENLSSALEVWLSWVRGVLLSVAKINEDFTPLHHGFPSSGNPVGKTSGSRLKGPASRLFAGHAITITKCTLMVPDACKIRRGCNFSKFPVKTMPLGVTCQSKELAKDQNCQTNRLWTTSPDRRH